MPFIGRIIFHRVLTTKTPIGKKVRPKMISTGEPLIRVKPKDLKAAGVERIPRITGVKGGSPQLEDGRTVDVANVVWCTGFHPAFSWIDLPMLDTQEPLHTRGIVESEPGLYFLGLKFLYSVSSEQIHGVGRDANHIAGTIAARRGERRPDRSVDDPSGQQDPTAPAQESEARISAVTRSP
jgi:putative flavoprotein involved in K+ transport